MAESPENLSRWGETKSFPGPVSRFPVAPEGLLWSFSVWVEAAAAAEVPDAEGVLLSL